ncbi:MAG TPA: ferredoxin--nitrite reductase [Dehalococcoidia bacterium]|nr:ferredoxin--nitrite reductase [Dehalococcoidia bacterium]
MAETMTRTKLEQIKAERDGLEAGEDIERFAREGWQSIPEDDRDSRLKWWGIFYRKQTPGHFMIRIRIPGGLSNAGQVREIGRIANDLGRGALDLTTRQQVQLRWIRIEDMPEVLDRLKAVGLLTLQTGLDNIRGVTGCAVAGLSAAELFDASPPVHAFNDRFVNNREFTNLPRKFNVAMTGCTENCIPAASQDVAMVPAVRRVGDEEVRGFNVLVGGKQGSGGFTPAQPLDAFVTPGEAPDVAEAITLVFRDYGSRETRSRARLAFLIEDWGMERFRLEVEARLGYALTPAGADARCESTVTDHIGLFPQRQPGLNYAGLLVPVGRTTGNQMLELARLAETYGDGEVRFTTGQNVVVPNIPDASLDAFLAEPLLQELKIEPAPVARGTVSCTGMDYCSLALIETKGYAQQVIEALDGAGRGCGPVSINWSGCPAGCGSHQTSDIGLLGRRKRIGPEHVIDTVDIFIGGSAGPDAVPGVKFMQDVPCENLSSLLETLIRHVDFDAVRRELRAHRSSGEAVTAGA